MASAAVSELKKKMDAAAENLSRQLQGMEPYLDKSDAPGEWTTRQVLCHLLEDPGWSPVTVLESFTTSSCRSSRSSPATLRSRPSDRR